MIIGASADQRLRLQLAEALERIRWLEDAMKPPAGSQIPGLKMSRSGEVVLYALLTAMSPLNQERLRRRLDVAFGRFDESSAKSVDVVICRLRKQLGAMDPPITIRSTWGRGYWIDDESKARVQRLQMGAEGNVHS